jgi:uncharacterized membrane protein YqjE
MKSNRENIEISHEKLKVYQIIFSMFIQLILVITGIVAFFIILVQIIKVNNNWTKVIYTACDSMLGGTLYVVYKHYFPAKGKI